MSDFYSPEVKLYIFDLDGTLVNTENPVLSYWNRALYNLGFDPEIFPYFKLVGSSSVDWKQELKSLYGDGFPMDKFENEFLKEKNMLNQENTKALPGAKEVLTFLKEKNKKCAIATANVLWKAKLLLKNAGLYDFFSFICTSEDVEHQKPDPAIYNLALKLGACDPKCARAIEDSFIGAQAAQSAGIPLTLIPSFTMTEDLLHQLSYDRICASLIDLIP
ncbi:HAD family hydrolase [Candidatus Similichlamydia epinepheli]|uniref:HAD family hydrolase n=1 Tax=Candidatus Similichlamydia epinepheli TaxID=1903953 RepID=UPI000D38C689|nr:HAD family phosphatase [Candidatus Similichlamydia epinepheli]